MEIKVKLSLMRTATGGGIASTVTSTEGLGAICVFGRPAPPSPHVARWPVSGSDAA